MIMNNLIDRQKRPALLQKFGAHHLMAMAMMLVVGLALWPVAPSLAQEETVSFMYWVDRGNDTIKRAALDGSGETILVSSLIDPAAIAVTPENIYWIEDGNDTIKRAALDGSGATTLVTGVVSGRGIAATSDYIYWLDAQDTTIKRAGLDGSGATTLVNGVRSGRGIAVTSNHIYWIERLTNGAIKRAALDGSGVTTLLTLPSNIRNPNALAVTFQYVYWINNVGREIKRVGLDGSNPTTLVSGLTTDSAGIAVTSQHIYWTELTSDTIKRSGLDGTNPITLIDSGLDSPLGIVTLDNVVTPVSFAPDGDFTKDRLRGWRVRTQEDMVSGMTYIKLRWNLLTGADGYEISVLDNGVTETSFRISHEEFAAMGQMYRLDRMPGSLVDPDDAGSDVLRYVTVQVRAYRVERGNYEYTLPTDTQHITFGNYEIEGPDGSSEWGDPETDRSGIVQLVQRVIDATGMDIDAQAVVVPLWFLLAAGVAAGGGWLASGGGWSGGGLVVAGIAFVAMWSVMGPALLGISILIGVAPLIVLALAGAWVAKGTFT